MNNIKATLAKLAAVTFVLLFVAGNARSQSDTTSETAPVYGKNVVRFMLSDYLIWGSTNLVFGYERVIDDKFSVTLNLGGASLPKLLSSSSDSVVTTNNQNKFGYHVSLEGRYYILSENKHPIPHGVYAGAFLSYNSYNKESTWDILHDDGPSDHINVDMNFSLALFGIQVGYQFIIMDHLTIDFVALGAGLGRYSYSAKADGDINNPDTKAALEQAQENIQKLFPNFDFFSEIKNGISGSNTSATFAPGIRYIISLGWNF